MIWWLVFEKKTFQFWREIWIQIVVILLQLYLAWQISARTHHHQIPFKIRQRELNSLVLSGLGYPLPNVVNWCLILGTFSTRSITVTSSFQIPSPSGQVLCSHFVSENTLRFSCKEARGAWLGFERRALLSKVDFT